MLCGNVFPHSFWICFVIHRNTWMVFTRTGISRRDGEREREREREATSIDESHRDVCRCKVWHHGFLNGRRVPRTEGCVPPTSGWFMHGRGCFVTHEALFIGNIAVLGSMELGTRCFKYWRMIWAPPWTMKTAAEAVVASAAESVLYSPVPTLSTIAILYGISLSICITHVHTPRHLCVISSWTIKLKRGVRANVPARDPSSSSPTCWFDNIRLY